ncbi:hypothetical protein EJ08DRAFT_655137 [Tothia fuscella]|uniref:Histidine kinase n=1 Tax=Tothia fuscella TaxID=1048955 RepID=A0A9P4U5H0_9PEZI|nr:hypothetical protein EJ08DRAFT_655137 [Tothia fuscella]
MIENLHEPTTPPPKQRKNLDWTRNPPPPDLTITPFQQFVRDVDWTKSPLGPMDSWCDQLRFMVLLVIADPQPSFLSWGETGLAEMWDPFVKLIHGQEKTGLAEMDYNKVIFVTRRGFLEECYFSWKWVPIIGPEGFAVGSHVTCHENTMECINERRSRLIVDLNARISAADPSYSSLWNAFVHGLESNDFDIPIAMVYTNFGTPLGTPTGNASTFMLEATVGIAQDHKCASNIVNLDHDHALVYSFHKARNTHKHIILSGADGSLPADIFEDLPWRGFGIPITELVICPIKVGAEVVAFFVVGLNPRRRYNAHYENFLNRIIQVVAPKLSSIMLAQERDRRATAIREAAFERAILASKLREDIIKKFVDRAPICLCITDINNSVIYANDSWYNFTGRSIQDRSPMQWLETILIEDRPILEEAWVKLAVEKIPWTFQIRSRQPFTRESDRGGRMETRFKTGWCAAYPDLDENGDVISVMVIIVDISELKWTEEQMLVQSKDLKQSELKYRQFATHAPIGVIRMSVDGQVEFANGAWEVIFDMSPSDIGKIMPCLHAISLVDRQNFMNFFDGIKRSKALSTVEMRLAKPWTMGAQAGFLAQPTWILVSGYAELSANGQVENIVCWAIDISAQKATLQDANAKMEEAVLQKTRQENFMDMISHEIRNPLSAVLACAEEIMDTISSYCNSERPDAANMISTQEAKHDSRVGLASALDSAQTILYCVNHQKRIVDDVLTLSKLDADLLDIAPVPTKITVVIRDALKMFDRELKAAAVQLSIIEDISLAENTIDYIMLDPNRFLQVLINLVNNAIKFTRTSPTRQILVRISATYQKPASSETMVYCPQTKQASRTVGFPSRRNGTDAVFMCFEVRDTGKGINDEEHTKLFKRFSQVSKTHIQYGGSGLGLWICRQITELMGGEIGVSKGQEEGATFAFFVRARKAQDKEIPVKSSTPHARTQSGPIPSTPPIKPSLEQSSRPIPGRSETNPGQPADSSITPSEHQNGTKVLVVEDNLINQKVLVKQLRSRGYLVTAANHGVEALNALRAASSSQHIPGEHSFNIVLCDIEMPIMGGLECVREIRRLEKEGVLHGHVPVIAVTANARSQQVQSALEAGMDDLTTKPYRIQEILKQIETHALPVPKIPPDDTAGE